MTERRASAGRRWPAVRATLAGLVALQLWTLFSAIAIFYGAAVAAQLEAVRAGNPQLQAHAEEARPRAQTSYAS